MINLQITSLLEGYRTGRFTVDAVIAQCLERCTAVPETVWITRLDRQRIQSFLDVLQGESPDTRPLYGVPFVMKDNIDLAGVPTTAGSPGYSYMPEKTAFVAEQLIAAGAVPLGKTNLDQFATGLVGTRSPYGACPNSFNPDYISGGSSSGSSVAVASGCCSFSLGTDTAGSGRVPAAFNNLVGLKPSRGLLSCSGVVPACKSLDCVSVFALDSADAQAVFNVAAAFDAADCYARTLSQAGSLSARWRFGVPQTGQLKFFGNAVYQAAFETSVELLEKAGGIKVEIDFSPFIEVANLLYSGPWVNERYAAVGDFIESSPGAVLPTTRRIIRSGLHMTAPEVFQAMYDVQTLKRKTDSILRKVDALVTPTAGTCYTMDEVNRNPVELNTNLGFYTNYMNLLDYAAVAVPSVMTAPVPFGVTLTSFAGHDQRLLQLAGLLHRASGLSVGRTDRKPADPSVEKIPGTVRVAVCGAHLKGYPLHRQLEELGAVFVESTRTAPEYKMIAFSSDGIAKPGLIHTPGQGNGIYVEIYELEMAAFGRFVHAVPAPLGIGKTVLADGSTVCGFIAEALVSELGEDITELGDWRTYARR